MKRSLPRVCLIGPESTGKTTLARTLAETFGTPFVPEYGRYYCETFGNDCDADDLRAIVAGQTLLEAAAERKGHTVLILDTDRLVTAIWADVLLGTRPADLDRIARLADLYLLTSPDVPFEQDSIRYFPDRAARERFFALCRAELMRRGAPFEILSGSHEQRLASALGALERHLAIRPPA